MAAQSRLHLLLASQPESTPSLGRLLARGRQVAPPTAGVCAALCRAFDVTGALAPILIEAEGSVVPSPDAWLRADPVHLLAGMHSVQMFDGRRFQLGGDEAASLVAALNSHFAGEAAFFAPHPMRWYVRFDPQIEFVAPPPDELAGVPIEPQLVSGPGATRLHRFAMEAQMLLHGLAVNDERELRGDLPVNGLWVWGGGPAARPAANFDRVWANDCTAQALARAAGVVGEPRPDAFRTESGRTLVLLDAGDPDRLEADWLAPILSALQRGRLDTLWLETPGIGRLQLGRAAAWQFWRR